MTEQVEGNYFVLEPNPYYQGKPSKIVAPYGEGAWGLNVRIYGENKK